MTPIEHDFSIKILDTLSEQIAVINHIGKIVYVNNSWLEFNKNNNGTTIFNDWENINYLTISDNSASHGDKLAQEASNGIRDVIEGKKSVFNLEYPCHSPNEERWFMMRVTPFELDQKNYFVLSHQNITERKLAENMMLKQTRNIAMGDIIHMLAHQWRQPLGILSVSLANIRMISELGTFDLGKKEEAKKYQEFVNDELNEVNTITQMLSKTIDNFTATPDNKLKELITLKELCDKSLYIVEMTLINSKIELIYDYKTTEKHSLFIEEIIQVIYYIVQNSQENFKSKSITNPQIKISVFENTISICDNGGGIPNEIIHKIFDPYFSTKTDLNGVGLGLYISKEVIEKHHDGKLLVKNENDGVCFKIIFKCNTNNNTPV